MVVVWRYHRHLFDKKKRADRLQEGRRRSFMVLQRGCDNRSSYPRGQAYVTTNKGMGPACKSPFRFYGAHSFDGNTRALVFFGLVGQQPCFSSELGSNTSMWGLGEKKKKKD